MSHRFDKKLRLVHLALLTAMLTGCRGTNLPNPFEAATWSSSNASEKTTEALLAQYGPTPAQKIEQLATFAKNAAQYPPHEQQQLCQTLAREMTTENDSVMRVEIIRTLAEFPNPIASGILRAGLESDQDTDVRIACCEAWTRRAGPEAVAMLSQAVANDDNVDVRLAALRSLGELRDPSVVPALALGLDAKEDPAVQHRAAQSLQQVTGLGYGNDLVAWRQFTANGGQPDPHRQQPSIAKRALSWWK